MIEWLDDILEAALWLLAFVVLCWVLRSRRSDSKSNDVYFGGADSNGCDHGGGDGGSCD